ncbi:hypothetical protein QQ045_017417 [Rhodiola kirilowii]
MKRSAARLPRSGKAIVEGARLPAPGVEVADQVSTLGKGGGSGSHGMRVAISGERVQAEVEADVVRGDVDVAASGPDLKLASEVLRRQPGRVYVERAKEFWQVKAAANRASGAGKELSFHPTLLAANEIVVSEEVWRRTASDWMFSLVGWIFGAKPVLGRLKGFIRSKWGDENMVRVSELKSGIFIFKFEQEDDFNRILALGPWSFDNRPLVIKPWSPDENYELESVTALLVWVRFPGLNLHMRNEEILSKIASTIGKPIRTDGFTAGSDKLAFARVLIEIYAEHELKTEICIKGPRGTNYYQRIQYDRVPPRCEHCHRFGHVGTQCPFPRLRIEEDEGDDPKVLLETDLEGTGEKHCSEVRGSKVLQINQVGGSDNTESLNGSSSGALSFVPESALVGGERNSAGEKELVSTNDSVSSSLQVGSDSVEVSKDSIEYEEPFIEVQRKLKKKAKKRRNKGKGGTAEVPVSSDRCEKVVSGCCPGNNWKSFCFDDGLCGKSRILILWDPEVYAVNIWFASAQIIICEVTWNNTRFMVGFVYAMNFQRERRVLWQVMVDAMQRVQGLWLFSGDFNCVKNQSEKLNGRPVRNNDGREISEFCDQTGMFDLAASGNLFTWSDRHELGARIWCKLDRILCNDDLIFSFPSIHGVFPDPGISDHYPAISFLSHKPQIRKWFRFQAFWTKTEEFRDCLSRWQGGASDLGQLQRRLKGFKMVVKHGLRNYRGDMNIRVDQQRLQLLSAQSSLAANPNCRALQIKESQEMLELKKLLRYQFIFNCQRARLNWAKEGDLNSKYFHSVIKGRRVRNAIRCLKIEGGEFSFDQNVVKTTLVNYFKDSFNGPFSSIPIVQAEMRAGPRVKDEECSVLVRSVSFNEITDIVNSLPSGKAAGPDGFNAEFFKASWNVIGPDVVKSICSFMQTRVMHPGINSAYLALIPKIKNACCPKDFRPISCCNVVYKIISTMLANRLKPVLKYLVNQSQSAFIEGRDIAHNISLVQELLGNYRRKHISKRCMLKLDISKAYDSVEWDFLKQAMEVFGFPVRFIEWILACVTSVKFSVLVNGSLEGYFGSRRGLRQGDPMSPYLFTLVMEVLSRLLVKLASSGNFDFHPKCGRTNLNHLMFADDVIIFSKASPSSLTKIREALDMFKSWSGLIISNDKSAVYFGGCSESEEILLPSLACCKRGTLPFTYLGVPLQGKQLKVADFSVIIDKMMSKIKAWSSRFLSYAGRLVLVKHVLSSIGSYWMRVLTFPKGVIKKITAIWRSFLWSGKASGKKNLVAWKEVCKPKLVGGLGILNLNLFNKARLLRQLWDVAQKKDSLWIKWMNIYFFRDFPLWQKVLKKHQSWILKNLLSLREDAMKCIEFGESFSLAWRSNSAPFSSKGAYALLMVGDEPKEWADIIWNDLAHPKHSFCVWLAVRDRLPTRARLRGLGISDRRCCWCSEEEEKGDHLFFQCRVSPHISSFLELIGIIVRWRSWDEVIAWKDSFIWRCGSQKKVAFFIITAATYEVWRARNKAIFEGDSSSLEAVSGLIGRMLKLKLELIKNTKSGNVCYTWCNNLLGLV